MTVEPIPSSSILACSPGESGINTWPSTTNKAPCSSPAIKVPMTPSGALSKRCLKRSAGVEMGCGSATRVRAAIGFGRGMLLTTIGVSAALLLMVIPRDAGLTSMVILVAAHSSYGFAMAMFNVNAITLRQVVPPPQVLARMNASYRMLLYGAGPVGSIAGGLLGNAVGLRTALVVALIAMTSPALWIFFSPVYRLREMPQGPPAAADSSPTKAQTEE